MRLLKLLNIVIILLVSLSSCNKSLSVVKSDTGPVSKAYDTVQYNLLFADAIKQKMLGNAGDAIRYFEQTISMNPQSDAAYFEISQITQLKGDFKTAATYANKAYQLEPENSWYINNLANIYFNMNKIDSVAWCYENLVEIEPQREDVVFSLGSLYIDMEEYEKALKIFNMLDNKYKDNPRVMMAFVNIYKGKGEKEKVESLLEKLIDSDKENTNYLGLLAEYYRQVGKNIEAVELYKTLFEKDPSNALLQLSYSDFLLAEKNYDELISFLNTVLLNENIVVSDKINLFAKIVSDSILVSQKKNDLILSAMVLKASDETNPTLSLLQSDLYLKLGETDKAIITLEEFRNTDKSNYFVWEKLLFMYNDKGDFEKLYSRSKEASSLFNRIPVPKLMYAFAATDRGEYDLGLKELAKARILANNQEAFLMQILLLEADIYYKMKEYTKSFGLFEEALKIEPEDPFVLNNYAYFLAEQSMDLPMAKELIERCIKIESNPTNLDTYAWVLYKMGKYKKAESIMISLEKEGLINDPELFEHFAYIKKARKDCESAVDLWHKALEGDSSKDYLIKEIAECSEK